MTDLTGRAALVTGASRGIGHAIAAELLTRGASVTITARKPDELAAAAKELVAGPAGGAADRVLAVGTTTVRVLETIAREGNLEGRTSLYVLPGFRFQRVDALLTNFHLPRSTLLALVMAFAGVDAVRDLYRIAIDEQYRFYSFGDAMLIL